MTAPDTSRELLDLAERVEAGEGADRELDELIMAATYTLDRRFIGARWDDTGEEYLDLVWVDPARDKWVSTAAYEFTSSLDRAVSFMERVLPGWGWKAGAPLPSPGKPWATVFTIEQRVHGNAPSPARALLSATLRALATQPKGDAS